MFNFLHQRKPLKSHQLNRRDKVIGDRWLFILPLCLTVFGLVMVFESSSITAVRDFNDHLYYFKRQLIWLTLSSVVGIIIAKFNHLNLKKVALPLFLFNVIILLFLVIGSPMSREVMGGRRWLDLKYASFQPSELIKISYSLYLAVLLEKNKKWTAFLVVTGIVVGLIMLQPDMGTTIVIVATAMAVYFVSGVSFKELIKVVIFGLVSFVLMILLSPYRFRRILTYINPENDSLGASYHLQQLLIALGSGGMFGRGFGQSRQKFLYLPEVSTDSIFAIVAEEFGFIGVFIIVGVYFVLITRMFRVITRTGDNFSKLVGTGITFFLGAQILINLSAVCGLLPITGIPLPFISYGGTALLINFIGLGIMYNISSRAIK